MRSRLESVATTHRCIDERLQAVAFLGILHYKADDIRAHRAIVDAMPQRPRVVFAALFGEHDPRKALIIAIGASGRYAALTSLFRALNMARKFGA